MENNNQQQNVVTQTSRFAMISVMLCFFANVDFQKDILLKFPFRGFLLDREGEVLAVHALDQRRTADDLLHLVCLKMADKVARLPEVGARIRLLDELLYVVLSLLPKKKSLRLRIRIASLYPFGRLREQ